MLLYSYTMSEHWDSWNPSLDSVAVRRALADTLCTVTCKAQKQPAPFQKARHTHHSTRARMQRPSEYPASSSTSQSTPLPHITPFPSVLPKASSNSPLCEPIHNSRWSTHCHLHDFLLSHWPGCLFIDLTGLTNMSHVGHDA